MTKRRELFLGGILVIVGALALIGALLHVSLWTYFWPLLFISLGVWFILRPRMVAERRAVSLKLIGDIKRRGAWQVADEEIWLIVGDVDLDLSQAVIPDGETRLSAYGFVGDVELIVPEGVGLKMHSLAFVSDAKVFGGKEESFVLPYDYATPGYDEAPKRIRLDTVHFVSELEVRAG
jgi:lia operon protein LiaF